MEHLNVELAHRLIHGQLAPATQAHWQEHLNGCRACRELLAAERALLAMLSLGETRAAPAGLDIQRVLDQVPGLGPRETAPARRRLAQVAASVACIVGLTILLAWQLHAKWSGPPSPTPMPGSPERVEDQVIVNLGALTALERDPWLADDYETVLTLERLVADPNR